MMTTEELVTILESHRTIGKAPREELVWIATHGTMRVITPGEIVASQTEVADSFYIVLSGRLSQYVTRGSGRRKVTEWVGGDVTGLLPYSRMKYPPGDAVAEELTEVLRIHRDELPALIRNCFEVTTHLVHVMTDRARQFTSTDLRDEKLISLGKLASGLAHELNNPASAAMRDAKSLAAALSVAEQAARDLAGKGLTPEQLEILDRVRDRSEGPDSQTALSGLMLADREETIVEWLDGRNIEGVPIEELARTGVTMDLLDRLAESFDGETLEAALRWIAGGANTRALAHEIERAVTRIHALVSSVKGFTHMDRAPVPEPVELSRGLQDTVAILDGKAREKSVAVSLTIAPDLPGIRGIGVEINQIWMNLIDNAIDAAPKGGHVNVIAAQNGTTIVIRVTDDGMGIPPEIQESIFDPFFTTKPVGEGTGLGLDIVRRVLQFHNGEINVESRPGRTEFRVTLPIAGIR